MKHFTTAAALVVGLNAGAVMAAESGEAADRLLQELDRNNDGVVSMEEARTSFDRADIDGDDELTAAEIEQAMAGGTDVTESEEVTESEVEEEVEEELAQEQSTIGDQLLRDLDVNEDGVVSREEASDHPQISRTFDQVDTDGDGDLGPAELAEVTGGPGGPGGGDGGGPGAAGGTGGGTGAGS